MKTGFKILILTIALGVMASCSAQKRAERHIRKAVSLCPDLVQVKARPFDTVLTAPGFADMAAFPLASLTNGDTLYAATDHGTVVVSLRQPDSALRVGFVAAPQEIHYQDTIRYSQVHIDPKPVAKEGTRFWSGFFIWIFGVGVGIWIFVYLFKNTPAAK